MGYEDSKYYEIIEEAIESGKSIEEIEEISLKALEEELAHPDIYGVWLVYHFNSNAENLAENGFDMEEDEFESGVKNAKKEIAIFRKYGHDRCASEMEEWLNEAIEDKKNEKEELL